MSPLAHFPLPEIYSAAVLAVGPLLGLRSRASPESQSHSVAPTMRRWGQTLLAVVLAATSMHLVGGSGPAALAIILAVVGYAPGRRKISTLFTAVSNTGRKLIWPTGSVAVLAALRGESNAPAFEIAMAVLLIANPLATLSGKAACRNSAVQFTRNGHSIYALLTLFVSTCMIVFAGLYFTLLPTDGWAAGETMLLGVAAGLVAAAAYRLSPRRSKELMVPVVTSLLLIGLEAPHGRAHFLAGEGLAMLVAVAAYRWRALTSDGATAAFLAGTFVFGFGGVLYALPMLAFFGLSSALSKATGSAAGEIVAKGARRDAGQVLANGLLPVAVVVFAKIYQLPEPLAFSAYTGAMAAVTADTWSTEIGIRFGRQPRMLFWGREVSPGTSGGMSSAGLVGGAAGASIVAAVAWAAMQLFSEVRLTLILATLLAVAGMLGHIVDSVLGAVFQAQYRCPVCSIATEHRQHCGVATAREKGVHWLDNDGVNFFCSLAGLLLGVLASFLDGQFR